jgi:hypothetical protein
LVIRLSIQAIEKQQFTLIKDLKTAIYALVAKWILAGTLLIEKSTFSSFYYKKSLEFFFFAANTVVSKLCLG